MKLLRLIVAVLLALFAGLVAWMFLQYANVFDKPILINTRKGK